MRRRTAKDNLDLELRKCFRSVKGMQKSCATMNNYVKYVILALEGLIGDFGGPWRATVYFEGILATRSKGCFERV